MSNFNRGFIYFIFLMSAALCSGGVASQQTISLSGAWDFSTSDSLHFSDHISLPGSMLEADKGDEVTVATQWTGSLYDSSFYFNPYMEPYRRAGQMKFPFFLTPSRHYVGKAWYRRTVHVPLSWQGQRITLFLERPHIETTVYVNGRSAGHRMSLSVPHEYDVTELLSAGSDNEILISVYNGIENVCVGQDSHSVTDQTQGNWNGIVGRISLEARPLNESICSVRVYPDVSRRTARVVVETLDEKPRKAKTDAKPLTSAVAEAVGERTHVVKAVVESSEEGRVVLSLPMGEEMLTWDEFSPDFYRLTVRHGDDICETSFGMRDFRIEGRQMFVNGKPAFIRGTVENCCFPLTGYPPTDEAEWLRIMRKCKEYGLNMIRFHSYCPPEAAFSAADKVGIYLQPEGPSWPNHGVKLRAGMAIDDYLLDESRRIVDTYGNNPSFVMMAAGNEPAGNWVAY